MFQRLFRQPSVEEVSVEKAKARQQVGALIVDVREPVEWKEGTIPGARCISLGSLTERVPELDPTQEIIMVCRSGQRSITAAMILQRAGFSRVSSMAGGMINWTRQHYPIRKG